MRCGVGKEKSDGNKGLNDDSPGGCSISSARFIDQASEMIVMLSFVLSCREECSVYVEMVNTLPCSLCMMPTHLPLLDAAKTRVIHAPTE